MLQCAVHVRLHIALSNTMDSRGDCNRNQAHRHRQKGNDHQQFEQRETVWPPGQVLPSLS